MKKLITVAIIFVFIFNKEAYPLDTLRPQLIFAKSKHDILIKLGIKDLDSDKIADTHIKTWLSEHKLFSHMPPLSLSSYLNGEEYDKYISDARRDRKLNKTKDYILDYAMGLYETEQNPGYQRLLAWIVSLESAFKENKAAAEGEGKIFKAKFVDYLTGRAGPHMPRLGREISISPLEWAAQGRFFWQVHEKRHGLLFGKMDVSGKPIGDLPLFPVDEKGLLDESLIQWMFKKDSAPPFKYYEARKVSLRELLKIDNKDKTDAMQLKLDFTGQALASGHTTVNSSLGPEFGRYAIEKRWFFRMMSNKKLWTELEGFNSPYIEDSVRKNIKRGTVEPMLPEHGRILDIMAGEVSMFDRKDERIATGIGLVKSFMSANPSLSDFIVRDLNNNPNLPVSGEFDAAVISFGIMYLTNPMRVLDSIRRHLKPGARIIIVFSGKYFDSTLAVNVFNKPEMYGYKDRVDVVESYIHRAGGFTDIKRNVINLDGEFVVISAIAEAISDRIGTIRRQTGRDL